MVPLFLFHTRKKEGIRTGAGVNDVPVARQSRDPACPAGQVESLRLHQTGTEVPYGASVPVSYPEKRIIDLQMEPTQQLSYSPNLNFR